MIWTAHIYLLAVSFVSRADIKIWQKNQLSQEEQKHRSSNLGLSDVVSDVVVRMVLCEILDSAESALESTQTKA